MKKKIWVGAIVIVAIVIFAGIFTINPFNKEYSDKTINEKRTSFISLKDDIIGSLITEGGYRCCLEKPCTYCIEKDPKHGEGATCDCLADIINGVHPCGECIGEILEGHGNPLLSDKFARAIAEKTGHEDDIKDIIFEKYDIPVEEQI
jgi:hypothetical protein